MRTEVGKSATAAALALRLGQIISHAWQLLKRLAVAIERFAYLGTACALASRSLLTRAATASLASLLIMA